MPAFFESEKCKGCGLCVAACPRKIVAQESGLLNKKGYSYASLRELDKCNACAFCAVACPDLVITVSE